MNEDDVWAAIDAQRLRTADLLEQLTDDEWQQPSLCAGWTVRDVAGHLSLQQAGVGTLLRAMLRTPRNLLDLNGLIRESARSRAALPTAQLIAELRGMVGSRRHVIGVTCRETLVDNLVHGQDIAIPLRRTLELPIAATMFAADGAWGYQGKRKARVFENVALGEFRLVASDAEWAVGGGPGGRGPEVRGPIGALLLLLTGRMVVLPSLTGDGADALRRQFLAA